MEPEIGGMLFEVEKGQGMQMASRLWKRQGNSSPLKSLEETQPCHHLDFYTSDLQNCKRINVCSFKSLRCTNLLQ